MSTTKEHISVHNTDKHQSGRPKAEVYKWTIVDEPGELVYLDKALLHINPRYQRRLREEKVLALAREWSFAECGALSVGHDNGVYWVYDGQHRLEAAKRHTGIEKLPCVVFRRMDERLQAKAFVGSNTNRKPMEAIEKYTASVVSQDARALMISKALETNNITFRTGKQGGRCVAAIYNVDLVAKLGEGILNWVLAAGGALCEGTDQHIDEHLLKGLGWCADMVVGAMDDSRFVDRLKAAGIDRVMSAMEKHRDMQGAGAKSDGLGLLAVVNHRLRNEYVVRARRAQKREPA